MKYYIWLDAGARPLSPAWRCGDETGRMAAGPQPPCAGAVLHAGTRQLPIGRFGLRAADFAD